MMNDKLAALMLYSSVIASSILVGCDTTNYPRMNDDAESMAKTRTRSSSDYNNRNSADNFSNHYVGEAVHYGSSGTVLKGTIDSMALYTPDSAALNWGKHPKLTVYVSVPKGEDTLTYRLHFTSLYVRQNADVLFHKGREISFPITNNGHSSGLDQEPIYDFIRIISK